jgi:predicted RNase H-like HicB family nuclease
MEQLKYAVIFEQAPEGNWGAYVPDLPGIAVGASTRKELVELTREAIELHISALKRHGLPVPAPVSQAEVVEVAVA